MDIARETSEYFLYESNNEINISEADRIRKNITDELSLTIFDNRLSYSRQLDNKYLRNIILTTEIGEIVNETVTDTEKTIFLYAAGRRGRRFVETFPSEKYAAFVDKMKEGTLCDMPIITIDKFAEDYIPQKTLIVITCIGANDEIKKELAAKGILVEDIISINEWNALAEKDIYFDNRFLNHKNMKGVFVDAGCFDGTNTIDYLAWIEDDNAQVIALEPEYSNYEKCKELLSGYKNVEVINCGVGSQNLISTISSQGDQSVISVKKKENDVAERTIEIVTIDSVCKNKNVSFIKMDIEGFEADAILGARNTIRRCKPVLAISVYHKREDIIDIPKLILDIDDQYEFYFGHYTIGMTDTVLYAKHKD